MGARMNLLNDRDYYLSRIDQCRESASRATSPETALIHKQFAAGYERALSTMAPEPPIMGSGTAHVV